MSQAALLNRTPRVIDGAAAGALPPCSLDSDAVTLEIVKKAEKEDCLVIRLGETKGAEAVGVLKLRNANLRVIETNLLEWTEETEYPVQNGAVELTLKPFEIKTLKLKA